MIPIARYLFPAALMALTAACGDDAAVSEGDDGRSATGEVLEGTISDAMIPIERVRSQPPLLAPEAAGEGGSGQTAGPDATAARPDATPEPAQDGEQPDPAPAAGEPADPSEDE